MMGGIVEILRMEDNVTGVKDGLKKKILLPVIGLLVLSISIILIVVLVVSSKSSFRLTNNLMDEMNQHYAETVRGQLNAAMNSVRALKPVFEQVETKPSRESDVNLLQGVLEQKRGIFGVFTLWEPNAYDGKDAEYAGKPGNDQTGRFLPYLYYGTSGIMIEALSGYETEGENDFYQIPKQTLKEIILEPYVDSSNGGNTYVSSMIVPLIRNGSFVGIIGMDISVDTLVDGLKGVSLFDSGYMFMTDSNGVIFSHPDSSVVGTSIYDIIGKKERELISEALDTGKKIQFDYISSVNNTKSRYLFNPVSVGDSYWMVASTAPVKEINQVTNMILFVGISIGVVFAIATAILLFILISRITRSIVPLVKAASAIELGDIDSSILQDLSEITSQDEIGLLARSISRAVESIEQIASDSKRISNAVENNDLSVKIDTSVHNGIYQEIMLVVNHIIEQMGDIVYSINTAVEQISTGTDHVSVGAQELATGSTEQAASIEELSDSMEKIAEYAANNTLIVNTAAGYIEEAGVGVNAGNEHMKQLTEAMVKIDLASNQIVSITKVIEDIASQTNLLSLNAAIEAARAGESGKGFAVVADEVRNLAEKSAEAAKQTKELVQASVSTVAKGTEITAQTANILQEIGVMAAKVNESFGKIENASAEQAGAIEQIKQGIFQVSAVVQNNAATAEENSAISEEMSAQAATLREDVGKFKLAKDTGYSKDV